MSITAITFAYFSASSKVDGVAFSFSKLETQILVNGNTITQDQSVNLGSKKQGDKILTSASVKLTSTSISGNIRVKVDFKALSGTNLENTQNMCVALNSLETSTTPYTTYADSSYKWQYIEGYYYLVSSTDSILNAAANTEYKLFSSDSTIYCPNLEDFRLTGGITDLDNIGLSIKCEAVQSNTGKSNPNDLHILLTDENIFAKDEVTSCFVRFETNGGLDVASQVVIKGTSISLPKVGDTSVDWYNGTTKVGTSSNNYTVTDNVTLFATYPLNSTEFCVYFDLDGATAGDTPETIKVTYATSGETIVTHTTAITKVGYQFTNWKVKGGTKTLNYDSSTKAITIPKNLTTAGNVVTIIPNWQLAEYTITFKDYTSYQSSFATALSGGQTSENDYILKYSISSNITLPTLNDVNTGGTTYYFVGWEVETSADVWKLSGVLKAETQASGLYGNVTIKPLWGIKDKLKFQSSTITKTYGDSSFTNPLTVNFINNSSVNILYQSSNASVATISTTGQVTIVGAGTATITATCNGNITATYSLTINQKDISGTNGATMDNVADQIYTGNAITPTPKVTLNGVQLNSSTDFDYSYSNNISVGTTATVIVTGKGNYTGSVSKTFNIVEPKMSAPTNLTWSNGKAQWNNVTDNKGYIVKLYRGEIQIGDSIQVDTNTKEYNFVSTLQMVGPASDNWKFGVITKGKSDTQNSDEAICSSAIRTYSITYNSGSVQGVTFGEIATSYKIEGSICTLSSVAPSVQIGENAKIGNTSIIGCDFNGWKSGTTYYGLSNAYSVDANLEVTAQWLSVVRFGTYNGKAVDWHVLNANSDNIALVVSRNVLEVQKKDSDTWGTEIYWDGKSGNDNHETCYTSSEIRSWLNSSDIINGVTVGSETYKGFLGLLQNCDFNKIKPSKIGDLCVDCSPKTYDASTCKYHQKRTGDLTTYDSSVTSGDKIFLLSQKDVETYYHYTIPRKKSGGKGYWWLRSRSSIDSVCYVMSNGNCLGGVSYKAECGVAPAMFLAL